jgi:hypothetical protein
MVLGLFSKKSDHPLADIKSVQNLLDDLPKADSLKALHELSEWMEALREHAPVFRADHQWTVLRLLDQAAQAHLRKVWHDYFAPQALAKFQENRLWSLLDAFYSQSDLCHFEILRRYREGDKSAASIKADLPLVCARGVAAVTGRLKLAVARYALVDPALWKHLAVYFTFAEGQDFHQTPIAMYAGVQTSVAQELSVLIAWHGSCSGNTNQLPGHISERLLAYLGKGLKLSASHNGECLFVFDLAQPTPPMYAISDATIHPALRFIEASGIRQPLESLVKTLEKGIAPDALNLYGAQYEKEMVCHIARDLLKSIVAPPPARRYPRRKINVNLQIANGFHRMLEQSDFGLRISAAESETWEVQDISATGFRCVVSLSRTDSGGSGEGLKIGSLIGSKAENVSQWGAAIVRRLRRDDQGKLHIGVEVLSPRIVVMPLLDRSKLGGGEYLIGLYLNRPNDVSGEAWLLIKPETFSGTRTLEMQLNDKNYLLMPLNLIERGDDYDLARYRMMEQDSSSSEE